VGRRGRARGAAPQPPPEPHVPVAYGIIDEIFRRSSMGRWDQMGYHEFLVAAIAKHPRKGI